MESNIHTSALKDKSLWLTVLVPLAVFVAKVAFKIDLSAELVASVLGPVLAYILSSKAKQAIVAKAEASVAGAAASARVDSLEAAVEALKGGGK